MRTQHQVKLYYGMAWYGHGSFTGSEAEALPQLSSLSYCRRSTVSRDSLAEKRDITLRELHSLNFPLDYFNLNYTRTFNFYFFFLPIKFKH